MLYLLWNNAIGVHRKYILAWMSDIPSIDTVCVGLLINYVTKSSFVIEMRKQGWLPMPTEIQG